jgi:micrococcal nuclease
MALLRRPNRGALIGAAVLAALLLIGSRTGLFDGARATPSAPVTEDGADRIARPWLNLSLPAGLKSGFVPVARVVDGDTLMVGRGRGESVRLIGVDCPEIGRETVDTQSPGWRATLFVYELLRADPQVRLEFDAERRDRYNRLLAYVWLPDGRMLNRLLLEQGWAEVMRIPPNTRYAGEFRELEARARQEGRGMWAP